VRILAHIRALRVAHKSWSWGEGGQVAAAAAEEAEVPADLEEAAVALAEEADLEEALAVALEADLEEAQAVALEADLEEAQAVEEADL